MAVVINGTSGITGNTGTLISATTIGVGGATPSASGAGITFPATQSASSDANTLDDYEEGTWTPTVGAQTGSLTAYTSSATYTKVGRIVNLSVYISITTKGTAADRMSITGLPFTITGVNSNDQPATLCRESQNSGVGYLVYGSGNTTGMNIQTLTTNSGINWQNNDVYSFTFTYRTAT